MISTLTTGLAQSCSSPPSQKLERLKNKGSSSFLYISGMPGTSKTATTMEVIRNLKAKYTFSFLAINAMQLTNSNLVYTIIYEKITGKKVAPASAALFLDEFFKKKGQEKILANALNSTRPQNLIRCKTKSFRTKPTS